MFSKSSIDLKKAGSAGTLVLDYLSGKKELSSFYAYPPSLKGFKKFIDSGHYKNLDRSILCAALRRQATLVKNTSDQSRANIDLLQRPGTFTVTTGHQLCLFTGPLYFIYKIAGVIKLARTLKAEFPKHEFIPVYWMASEDHDFEEVNHFHLQQKTVRWQNKQSGAVGDLNTAELEHLLPEIQEALGNSDHAQELFQLFKDSYIAHHNLADATRHLVNALFADTGLVIADGNDATLKAQFRNEFSRDIFEGLTQKSVGNSIKELENHGYHIQVKPRDINVFLLSGQQRLRLEKKGELYAAGTEKTFTAEALRELIAASPEQFSPNVSLRPLYQQKILPNISYSGGPGELAYWLEYKGMFDTYGITFPILMPRSFFSIVEPATVGKLKRLGFTSSDLFQPLNELVNGFQEKSGKTETAGNEKKAIEKVYAELVKKAQSIDPTLVKHVNALRQKHLDNITGLEKKLNRALRKKSETEISRIQAAKEAFFPGGVPQERYFNFSVFYLMYGKSFLKEIIERSEPFSQTHILLEDRNEL